MVKVHLNSEIYVLIFTRHELKRLEALQEALLDKDR